MKAIKSTTVRAVASATFLLVACDNAYAGQTPTEERALHRFGQAVSEYAGLHRQLERSLPPLEVTDDMEALYVLGQDHVVERIVALGDRYGDAAAVRCVVAAGERVVVKPHRRLPEGREVLRSAPRY